MWKLLRYKADESYDEIVGASSGQRSTTDAIFRLRMMMEKWREGQKELHCVFIDLEKVYDRVPREELWECMHQAGVPECYVESIQDMYKGARTSVRSVAGLTEDFEVRVGLHQGSALSPFLLAIIMDVADKGCEKRSSMGHDVRR